MRSDPSTPCSGWTSLLETLPQGVLLSDAEGHFVEANAAACRILGVTRQDLLASGFLSPRWIVLGPDGFRLSAEALPGVFSLRTGSPVQQRRLGLLREDREIQWLEITAGPLPEGGAVVTFEDVTERRRIEAVLRRSESMVQESTDQLMEGCQIIGFDWRYLYINASAARHGRKPKGVFLGQTLMALFPGIEHSELFAVLKDCMETRSGRRMENEFLYEDGARGWFELSIQPVEEGLRILSVDITERKEAQAEIRRMNEDLERRVLARTVQLEAANRELEAFSYSVSHDLRGPLQAMDGFSQILVEDHGGGLDETGRHCLSRIRAGARRMAQILEGLLNLSQISQGEMSPAEIDLSHLCGKVLGDLVRVHPEQCLAVRVCPGMRVRADHRLLLVALENLLGNAWKFTASREGGCIEVGETSSAEEQRAFFIRDNGAGFDMALAGKLFRPFQRLHASGESEGTGIGLAIAARIIQRHGGRIWAQAEPGKGATFYFTL